MNYDESVLNDYGSSSDGKNPDVKANSYMYEFSAATCPWTVDGQPATWNAWKENQLAKGDENNGATVDRPIPYSSSRMPIVRCYHHTRHGKIKARDEDGNLGPKPITLNVAYAGNVIISPLWWEGALEPGQE